MSGVAGWSGISATHETASEALGVMGRALVGDRGLTVFPWLGSRAALVTAPANGIEPSARERGWCAALVGRPRFGDPALASLARERGPAAALIEGFVRRGPGMLRSLHGAFGLALQREDGGEALLAIDRVGGRHPLCYKTVGEGLIFGSSPGSIEAHPRGRSEVDPQGLYDYLYFHVIPAPRTVRRDVRSLLPGHYLHYRNGVARLVRYWEMEFFEDRPAPLDELVTEFRQLVRQSVELDVLGAPELGCFLSGGVDSSTLAGMVGQVTGRPARTFSIGFDAAGYDEMEYARTTVRHFGTRHREYYVTPDDVLAAIPRIARAYADPFGNASAVPTYYCARAAREDGVLRLLGGDGGDELFAGNERYATQSMFALYQRVPGALRRGLVEPLVFGLPGLGRIAPFGKLRGYIRQAQVSMPRRLQAYNQFERRSPAEILEPGFLASIDTEAPLALLEEAYHGARASSMVNRMLALDMRLTIADNDLPKVSRMCELAGVEVAYPLLSDELIEFAAGVPSELKLRGRRLRWFMKHALRDFLPPRVLTKPKHGFGLPFGVWLREHDGLREFSRESLRSLGRRGLVRPDYLAELSRLHQTDHAAYYGGLIWVLMMLEQWFQAQAERPARAG